MLGWLTDIPQGFHSSRAGYGFALDHGLMFAGCCCQLTMASECEGLPWHSLLPLCDPIHPEKTTQDFSFSTHSIILYIQANITVAHPNAIVPRVTFGFCRHHPQSATHSSTAQTVATLHFICNDPHLGEKTHMLHLHRGKT